MKSCCLALNLDRGKGKYLWLTGKIITVIIHMPAVMITKPGFKMFSSRILMGTKGGLKHLFIIALFAYFGEALCVSLILFISFISVYYCVCVCILSLALMFHPFLLTLSALLLNYFSFYFYSFLNHVLPT